MKGNDDPNGRKKMTEFGVLYARVSTDEQAERGLSIPAQIEACRKYAAENGIEMVREFVDEGLTARTSHRPEFQDMIAYCKANRSIRAVIVYDTSRFCRNRYDAALFKVMLEKLQVRVHYATQKIEDTPEGHFMEGILELFDEHYSRSLARVVKRGMKEAAKRGNWLGAPPWGYLLVRNQGKRTLQVCPRTSPGVKLAFGLFQKGYGCRTIAEKLNEKGFRSKSGRPFLAEKVRNVLKNPAYAGDTVFNRRPAGRYRRHPREEWVIVKDTHEPLVSREVFEAVQKELERRGRNRRPGELKTHRRFAGLVKCARCGATANAETGTSKQGNLHFYYSCRTRAKASKELCEGFRVRVDRLEGALISAIEEKVFSDENVAAYIGYVQERLRDADRDRSSEKIRIRRRLEGIDTRLRRVVTAVEEGAIDNDQARSRTAELKSEREELQARLAKVSDAEALAQLVPTRAVLEAARRELRELVRESDARAQRTFFGRFIRGIKVEGESAEVTYNLGHLGTPEGVRNSIKVSGP